MLLIIRPEDVEILPNAPKNHKLKAKVISSSYMGSWFNVTLKWKDTLLKAETKNIVENGQEVCFQFDSSSICALPYVNEQIEVKEND